jgi:hypothetical protein
LLHKFGGGFRILLLKKTVYLGDRENLKSGIFYHKTSECYLVFPKNQLYFPVSYPYIQDSSFVHEMLHGKTAPLGSFEGLATGELDTYDFVFLAKGSA